MPPGSTRHTPLKVDAGFSYKVHKSETLKKTIRAFRVLKPLKSLIPSTEKNKNHLNDPS